MLFGYARETLFDQNLDLQVEALSQAGIEKTYTDTETSQPKLTELLGLLKKGDILVIWKLDRLGRSLQELVKIINQLEEKGVGLRSMTESFDTTKSDGKLLFHLFGALGEFERGITRERTLTGIEAAKREGRVGGRPRSLSTQQIGKAEELVEKGETISAIARKLNCSRWTISRAIRRRGN